METIKIEKKFKSIKKLVNKSILKRNISSSELNHINKYHYNFNKNYLNFYSKLNNSWRTASLKKNNMEFTSNTNNEYKFNNKFKYNFLTKTRKCNTNNFQFLKDNNLKHFFYKRNKYELNNKILKLKNILKRK